MSRREFVRELITSNLKKHSYQVSDECIDDMVEDIMYFFHVGNEK